MTRSLNFCLGSGGSSVGAVDVLSSTCGNCRSTLALEIKWGMVTGLQLMRIIAVLKDLLGILLDFDPFPRSVWVCCFWSFGLYPTLCHIFLFLLGFSW